MIERALGCIQIPDLGTPRIEPFLGANPLPDNFVVSYYQHLFDGNYNAIYEETSKVIVDQLYIPSCVGCATAYQEAAKEKVKMSPRDFYRQAKRLDGSGSILSYGTTLNAAQDAGVNPGAASEDVVPSDHMKPLEDYVSTNDVTDKVRADRKAHKNKSYYSVARTNFAQAMFDFDIPIVSSLEWYSNDNAVGKDGVMEWAEGADQGGHALCFVGWRTRNGVRQFILLHSFGDQYAHHGVGYVPNNVMSRFGNGRVSIDMPHAVAELITRYDGKTVRVPGKPEHYQVMSGIVRKFPNEIVLWANGKLFGRDVFDIQADELEVMAKGPDMDMSTADPKTAELVRQIRQHFGAL